MTIEQGDMITKTTFNTVIVDIEDMIPILEDMGLSNKQAIEKAQKLIKSDYFRRKVTDIFLIDWQQNLEIAIKEYGDLE